MTIVGRCQLSNRRELERYFELVNTTDDDRVENVEHELSETRKSFGVLDEKSTREICSSEIQSAEKWKRHVRRSTF